MLARIKSLIGYVVSAKMDWPVPDKCDILVYDEAGSEPFLEYLRQYKYQILSIRGERLNVYCLIRSVKGMLAGKGPLEAYIDSSIRAVSPKVIITFIDNNPKYYFLSTKHPDIKTIFVQNGWRGIVGDVGDLFETTEKDAGYKVDFMLVFNRKIGSFYRSKIVGDVLTIGSVRNNKVVVDGQVNKNRVLFISQFRDKESEDGVFLSCSDGGVVLWDSFYEAERRVALFLAKWCKKSDMDLVVCGMQDTENGTEQQWYASLLHGYEWQYLPRTSSYSSYAYVDSAELVVGIDSTLVYESLGRGRKTAVFSCRRALCGMNGTEFGWPADFSDNGPFWTNDPDENQLLRVMDILNSLNYDAWDELCLRYLPDLMEFDAGNKCLKSLLQKLLVETV